MKGHSVLDTVDDYIAVDLTHSIHTSGRRSFRGCRRRWDWLFRQYFYPITTAKPLEFGVAYHKAMEVFFEPTLWDKPRDIVTALAIQAFRGKCKEQFTKYQEAFGLPDKEVIVDYEERLELGEGMISHFAEVSVHDKKLEGMTPTHVEVSFEVPIEDPDTGEGLWCKCGSCWDRYKAYILTQRPDVFDDFGVPALPSWIGLPVTYGGRIDAIMQGPDGRYWIVDWKTAARLAEENDRTEFLALDDQITSYCAALNKLGADIAGFIYFEQKKAYPVEPEPNVRRRLGRLFSVNKQQIADATLYEETVKELDPEAYEQGLYEEHIEWLRLNGGRYHASYREYRNQEELHQCWINIWNEASDMVDPNLRIYPNAGRFNCTNCAFRQPCLEQNSGGDYMYALETMFEKRRYHYWVEKQPSTESKGNE